MRRQSQDDVAEAARRRLDLLERELEQAGLTRVHPVDGDQLEEDLPEGDEVAPGGRHVRARGRVLGLLPDTFRGRAGLAAGPALLVVALVVLGLAVTAWAVARSGGETTRVPAATGPAVSPLVPLPSGGTSASPAAGRSTASATVTVDVAGKVRRPGVTTLPAGSRVIDALERAGGARPGVALAGLNLARVLVDGEQILVGAPAQPGGQAASAAAGAGPPEGGLVNLNTATLEQLDTLPGVGPVTAQKILDWRAAHGAFSSVDELLEVDGIGDKTLAELAPRATL